MSPSAGTAPQLSLIHICIIVGIVALPLAIAFGIASGVSPEKEMCIRDRQCVVYWKTFTNFAVPSPRMATYCLVKVFR